jgi:hypothetical protein
MDMCCYFPSYEVITSPHVRGNYYAEDGREVLTAGVKHVMGLLSQHFFETGAGLAKPAVVVVEPDAHTQRMENLIEVLCDEESIDNV